MNGVVLISGGGSNLQSIIDNADEIDLSIQCVISNKPSAYGLKRAAQANIQNCIIDHQLFDSRQDFDVALMSAIDEYQPEIVILAGFMRILSDKFINKYQGKVLNIHPSLLPKYPGLNTHQKAIDARSEEHTSELQSQAYLVCRLLLEKKKTKKRKKKTKKHNKKQNKQHNKNTT